MCFRQECVKAHSRRGTLDGGGHLPSSPGPAGAPARGMRARLPPDTRCAPPEAHDPTPQTREPAPKAHYGPCERCTVCFRQECVKAHLAERLRARSL